MAGQYFRCEECKKIALEWAYGPWGGRYFCYECGSVMPPPFGKLLP